MTGLSASEACATAQDVVRNVWKASYMLSVRKVSLLGEDGAWLVRGVLSQPTKQRPIATAVVRVTFKLEDADRVEFRLENLLQWRPVHKYNEMIVDRIVLDKLRLRSLHKDIVRDAFCASRGQVGFEQQINEETKIREDNTAPVYSDFSDDEILPDDILLGPLVPDESDEEEKADEALRGLKARIRGVVAKSFAEAVAQGDPEEGQPELAGYFRCLAAVQQCVLELNLTEDDRIVAYAQIPHGERLDIGEVQASITTLLEARLSSPYYGTCSKVFGEELLVFHSPESKHQLLYIWDEILASTEKDATVIPRSVLFECLLCEGDGVFTKEANAVMAFQHTSDDNVDLVALPTLVGLTQQLAAVRLAFARNIRLEFPHPQDLEHLLAQVWETNSAALVAKARNDEDGQLGGGEGKESSSEDETKDEANDEPQDLELHTVLDFLTCPEVQTYVLSKLSAVRVLARLPRPTGHFSDVLTSVARMVWEEAQPAFLSRQAILRTAHADELLPEDFLKELKDETLETRLLDLDVLLPESIQAFCSGDCNGATDTKVIESLLTAGGNIDKKMIRIVHDDQTVARIVAADLEEGKRQAEFRDQHGTFKITGITPVENDQVEVTAKNESTGIDEAFGTFTIAFLANELGLEDPGILISEALDSDPAMDELQRGLYAHNDAPEALRFRVEPQDCVLGTTIAEQ